MSRSPLTNAFRILAASTCNLLVVSSPALAQQELTVRVERPTLDEVVVSAQKRGEQNLQVVPLSIQVVSGDTLEKIGVTDFLDAAKFVPSLGIIESGNGSYQIYMRGIITGPAATSATQDKPLTSVYIDEIPISFANYSPNFNMFDVERVEVLRGPQGTLYGAGSMGGNVRIVTRPPSTTEFDAKLETQVASTEDGDESYALKGALDIPLIENQLAMRISGTTAREGGYIDNPLRDENNVNTIDRDSGRVAFRWTPFEPLDVQLNLMWQQLEADDNARRTIPGTQTLYDNVQFEDDFTNIQTLPDRFFDQNKLANLTITYDLEWAQLVSSSSYFDREFIHYQQGFFAEFFDKLINGDIAVEGWVIDEWDVHDFVQEIRLASPDRRLDWVIGAFYADQSADFVDDYPVENFEERTGLPTDIWGAPKNNLFKGHTENTQQQFAVFGELTYGFTENLDGTVALRWFNWDQDFFQRFSGLFNGGVTIKDETTSAEKFTPKYSLAYRITDDAMIYATAAKGFRLGGVNDPVPPELCAPELAEIGLTEAPSTFGPDSLWNYELGAKTAWLDRRLILNATFYYLDWTDIQTRRTLPQCGFFFTENVGEAESSGVELELISAPTDALTLTLSAVYTKAELSEDVPNLGAEKGDQAPYVPEISASASIDYWHPLTSTLDWYTRFDVKYVDSRGTSYAGGNSLPAYEIGNVHLGIAAKDGRWESELFVNNLWDEEAILNESGVSFTGRGATQLVETPRTAGILFRWNF